MYNQFYSDRDAMMYLRDSFVLYEGDYRWVGACEHGKACLYRARRGDWYKWVDIRELTLDIPEPGFLLVGNKIYNVKRRPARQFKVGLNRNNTITSLMPNYLIASTRATDLPNICSTTKDPVLKRTNGVISSRFYINTGKWMLDGKKGRVYHTNVHGPIGTFKGKDDRPVFLDRFSYLAEAFEEDYNEVV